jgi:hypothetical protein
MQSQMGHAVADQTRRRCPECRDTLVFSTRYPVLSDRTRGGGPGDDGIRYQTAWVCRNGRCDYRKLVDEN